MFRSIFKSLGISGLALVLGGISVPASADPQCLTYSGLQHCPVNGTTLGLTPNKARLTVTASNQPGGVWIATPGASSWNGNSRIRLASGQGDVLKASSISQGQVTSGAEALRVSNGYRLSATFTASNEAPTFSTLVYRNGILQGSSGNNASGSNAAFIGTPVVLAGWENLQWPDFIVAQGGACTWVYQTATGTDREITLPDGRTFLGDEIRFAEEVNPSGAYPYLTFDSLVFEGNIHSSNFLSEVVQ